MGGTVSVSSEGRGKGTQSRCVPTPARRKVVVVEDNVDGAESLREVLELVGHEVHVTFTGTAGIAAAVQTAADVVLCDIGLPDMTGFDVARALRATAGFTGKLVALTGFTSPDDEKLAAEAGFDHHFPKPANLARLTALLDED